MLFNIAIWLNARPLQPLALQSEGGTAKYNMLSYKTANEAFTVLGERRSRRVRFLVSRIPDRERSQGPRNRAYRRSLRFGRGQDDICSLASASNTICAVVALRRPHIRSEPSHLVGHVPLTGRSVG